MKKEKAPVDVTLEKATVPVPRRSWWGWEEDDDNESGDRAVVRIDLWTRGPRSLAVVDTTFAADDDVTDHWFRREIAPLLRAPLVVGLVALRGHAPPWSPTPWSWGVEQRGNPQSPENPIRCIALCVGGSHSLVYRPDCYSIRRSKSIDGPLDLIREDNKMKELRKFLADDRVTVACVGAKETAKKLAEEWGVHVGRPAELTDLFARAFGKEAECKPEKPPREPRPKKEYYGVMSRDQIARAKAKANAQAEAEDQEYEENSKPGRWMPKAIKGLSLERMARVALGPDMRMAPWPAKLVHANWGCRNNWGLSNDKLMYATRDAYLCFDIAATCLPKIGAPIA